MGKLFSWRPIALGVDIAALFSRQSLIAEAFFAALVYVVLGVMGAATDEPFLFLALVGPSLLVAALLGLLLVRNFRRLHPSAPSRLRHIPGKCSRVAIIVKTTDDSLDLVTTCEVCGASVEQKQREREREPGLPNWVVAHGGPTEDLLPFAGVLFTVYCFDRDEERLFKCTVSTVDGAEVITKDLTREGSAFSDRIDRVARIEPRSEWKLYFPTDFTHDQDDIPVPTDGLFFVDWYAIGVSDRLVKRDLFELKRGRLVR